MTILKSQCKYRRIHLTVLVALSILSDAGQAATGDQPAPPAAIKPSAGAMVTTPPKAESHPFWIELTASQKNALAPLESEWSKIDAFRKKKWLQIGSRFETMKPDEQQRIQEKMRVWAKLTPDQRRHAREVYSRTKSLDADQKSAQWQEYQSLPETEKNRLAKDIAAKKHVANLPTAPKSPLITPPKLLGGSAVKNSTPPSTTPAAADNSPPAAPPANAVPAK